VTPSIEFFLDGLPESALALDSLLAKVREQDAEVSKLRKEASYAGEPNAYKAPKIIDNSNKPTPADRITNWDDV
jgi:ribosome-binding factor A